MPECCTYLLNLLSEPIARSDRLEMMIEKIFWKYPIYADKRFKFDQRH